MIRPQPSTRLDQFGIQEICDPETGNKILFCTPKTEHDSSPEPIPNLESESLKPIKGCLIKLRRIAFKIYFKLVPDSLEELVAPSAAGALVMLSGCTHFKRVFGPRQSQRPPTEAQALEAGNNGNFLLARRYFNDKLCDEATERVEKCEEGKEKNGCQIAAVQVEHCEEVIDGVAGTIDFFKKEIKKLEQELKYAEAINRINDTLSVLDADDELYKKLASKREWLRSETQKSKQRYPKDLKRLAQIISNEQEFKEETWDDLRLLIEQLRKDRDIIEETDKTLFNLVIKLARKLYKKGDYEKAEKAGKMAENVDLGETSFATETQVTSEVAALFGAIDAKIQGQKVERTQQIRAIMDALKPIEKRFKVFFKTRRGSSAARELAREIRNRTDKVYLDNKAFIDSNEALRQRVRNIYKNLNRKGRKQKTRTAPEPVVPPIDTPQPPEPPAPPPPIAQQPSLKGKWNQEKWDGADQLWRDQSKDGIAAYEEVLTWGDLPSGKRSLAEKRLRRLKRAFGEK